VVVTLLLFFLSDRFVLSYDLVILVPKIQNMLKICLPEMLCLLFTRTFILKKFRENRAKRTVKKINDSYP